jgi:4-hydroxybenzoate polyprenyltransferase
VIRGPAIVRALRPAQWTKNGLVFAAFIFALGDRSQQLPLQLGWLVLAAAVCFCLISSAIYLVNDINDREADRLHPTKKMRPIAAGELSVGTAWATAAGLAVASLGVSWWIAPALTAVLGGYGVMQLLYTFGLKKVALLDVFVIAAGFVLRALAGAVAIDVPISPWLLLCTLLLALFLGLCKRRHEKVVLADVAAGTRASMREYDARLLDQLIAMVGAATIVSYALYTLWPDTVEKFGTTKLGFTIPFVLFGLFRYLDLVYRHEKGGRPEKILLTDMPILVNLLLYGLTVLFIVWRYAL